MFYEKSHVSKYQLKKLAVVGIIAVLAVLFALLGKFISPGKAPERGNISLNDVPEYAGRPSTVLNNNIPSFTDDEYNKAKSKFINISNMDDMGRAGVCVASLGTDTLATGERHSISYIHPSGFKQAFYPEIIKNSNGALYNRSHLIMYAVSGILDDERNIITGTEYMNQRGMLPYETALHNFILKYPNERILYRVCPIFGAFEIVARGVHMEAGSVSDKGKSFHVNAYCYNVEPGITIDYKTGDSMSK